MNWNISLKSFILILIQVIPHTTQSSLVSSIMIKIHCSGRCTVGKRRDERWLAKSSPSAGCKQANIRTYGNNPEYVTWHVCSKPDTRARWPRAWERGCRRGGRTKGPWGPDTPRWGHSAGPTAASLGLFLPPRLEPVYSQELDLPVTSC